MGSLWLFILQTDKDVVREFIYSDGLTCLVKIGSDANHSYQGYILRGKDANHSYQG